MLSRHSNSFQLGLLTQSQSRPRRSKTHLTMDASLDVDSHYHSLPSALEPEPPTFLQTLSYIRSHPVECLQSFLAFHHYAIVSYILILTHFLLLYLSAFLLLFDYLTSSSLPPRPYVILLSFYVARSTLLLVAFSLRLRFPTLWYRSATSIHSRRFLFVLTVSRLLSVAFLVFGSLHWLLLTPYVAMEDSDSLLLSSPAVPCLLLRECLTLLLPLTAMAYLRVKGQRRGQVSAFVPYLLSATQLSHTAADGERATDSRKRGLSTAEIRQLGEESYSRAAATEEAEVCAICLSELADGVRVRRLRCSHGFHSSCVDVWLQKRSTCPLCVQLCAPTVSCSVAIAPLVEEDSVEVSEALEMLRFER